MTCCKIAFPALTVESIIVILFSIFVIVYIEVNYGQNRTDAARK